MASRNTTYTKGVLCIVQHNFCNFRNARFFAIVRNVRRWRSLSRLADDFRFFCLFFAFSCLIIARVKLNPRGLTFSFIRVLHFLNVSKRCSTSLLTNLDTALLVLKRQIRERVAHPDNKRSVEEGKLVKSDSNAREL